jgi:hypothetical protein
MRRRLFRCGLLAAAVACSSQLPAVSAAGNFAASPVLKRFFAIDDGGLLQYRALRHFQARNEKLDASAWMDVWTEADITGFRYQIAAEGGSSYIRERVFASALEAERDAWGVTDGRGTISADNYEFGDCDSQDRPSAEPGSGSALTSVACVGLKPRRKDVFLVNGAIFLKPDDGDLVRIEGSLAKTPSFWTRRVDIIRRYERIAGVRLPVALESVASLRLAGASTFTMTYQYESVNGRRVASSH